jgi:hypothetical protein
VFLVFLVSIIGYKFEQVHLADKQLLTNSPKSLTEPEKLVTKLFNTLKQLSINQQASYNIFFFGASPNRQYLINQQPDQIKNNL